MNQTRRIRYNSPVVLTFALLSLLALLLGKITGGRSTTLLFCVYRSSFRDIFTYPRFFLHVLGHSGWAHYSGNIMLMLVVGPQLEARYGSRTLLYAVTVTAFLTGLIQFVFFPGTALMGASGIVFMMILLASMGSERGGGIPLTLILVALFYIGGEIFTAVTSADNISQLSHVIGGICGAILGFRLQKQ